MYVVLAILELSINIKHLQVLSITALVTLFLLDFADRQSAGVVATLSPGVGFKRMSFGPYISLKYIDKHMPPSSPVRKGVTHPSSDKTHREESGLGIYAHFTAQEEHEEASH